jgi:hypothetical protein
VCSFTLYSSETIKAYFEKLRTLAVNKRITEFQFDQLKRRGIQVISPRKDFGLEHLDKVLNEIVIGATEQFIESLSVPYQATSFVAAEVDGKPLDSSRKSKLYIYKVPGEPRGGVKLLTGGKRAFGDNVFASLNRILIGHKAVISSAANLVVNKDNVWDWQFYGQHLKSDYLDIYNDLEALYEKIRKKKLIGKVANRSEHHYMVVVARTESSFRKLRIVEEFLEGRIAVLDPDKGYVVIFVTDKSGYEYAERKMRESDLIKYIVTGKKFDISNGLYQLRKDFEIDIILNDGGRIMSNAFRDMGLLAEERITIEPNPGNIFVPELVDPTSILGADGTGLDNSELGGAILVKSKPINKERANVYVYPLCRNYVLHH